VVLAAVVVTAYAKDLVESSGCSSIPTVGWWRLKSSD